jgi:hypothetical protein
MCRRRSLRVGLQRRGGAVGCQRRGRRRAWGAQSSPASLNHQHAFDPATQHSTAQHSNSTAGWLRRRPCGKQQCIQSTTGTHGSMHSAGGCPPAVVLSSLLPTPLETRGQEDPEPSREATGVRGATLAHPMDHPTAKAGCSMGGHTSRADRSSHSWSPPTQDSDHHARTDKGMGCPKLCRSATESGPPAQGGSFVNTLASVLEHMAKQGCCSCRWLLSQPPPHCTCPVNPNPSPTNPPPRTLI